MGCTIGLFAGEQKCPGGGVTTWMKLTVLIKWYRCDDLGRVLINAQKALRLTPPPRSQPDDLARGVVFTNGSSQARRGIPERRPQPASPVATRRRKPLAGEPRRIL